MRSAEIVFWQKQATNIEARRLITTINVLRTHSVVTQKKLNFKTVFSYGAAFIRRSSRMHIARAMRIRMASSPFVLHNRQPTKCIHGEKDEEDISRHLLRKGSQVGIMSVATGFAYLNYFEFDVISMASNNRQLLRAIYSERVSSSYQDSNLYR